MYAAGAFLLVLDLLAYNRYREIKDRTEQALHLGRTSRIRGVLHSDVLAPLEGVAPHELTAGPVPKAIPSAGDEEVEFLSDNMLDLQQAARSEALDFESEGELVFLPPASDTNASLSPLSNYPMLQQPPSRAEEVINLEARLRAFESFQSRCEAELNLLRSNFEAIEQRLLGEMQRHATGIHPASLQGPQPANGNGIERAKLPTTLKGLRELRDKLEREVKLLQNRYMKGHLDSNTYQKLFTELHRDLNRVHASAAELAEKKG